MIRRNLDAPNVLVVVLVAATLLTWVLGVETATSHTVAGAGALTIGFVKLRLVGIHFMEIGGAPALLRIVFESYVVLTFGVLLALYLVL